MCCLRILATTNSSQLLFSNKLVEIIKNSMIKSEKLIHKMLLLFIGYNNEQESTVLAVLTTVTYYK